MRTLQSGCKLHEEMREARKETPARQLTEYKYKRRFVILIRKKHKVNAD